MKSNIKYTIEQVRELVNQYGYDLISKTYINTHTNLILKDKEGYYYFGTLSNLRKGEPRKFDIRNPYTIQNIKLWCFLNNKPFELVSEIYNGNEIYLEWKCLRDDCGEIFPATWNNVSKGRGCGYCHGKQVGLSNCLATKNPELAKEWHATKNGDLTPYEVTSNSHQEVWWMCNEGHEWKSTVDNRTKRGCSKCSGRTPSAEYNLLVCNPELAREWNYARNKKNPEEYCPGSSKSVWWQCSKNPAHEWKAIILNRNKGNNSTGCPECSESKGEKEIKKFLINKGLVQILQDDYNILPTPDKTKSIFFIPQKYFKGLHGVGNGFLSYDFYVPNYNLLIEYQGLQHEKYVKGFHKSQRAFEIQLEHDRRKREFAEINNINLLEIWYWDFENIEQILTNYLEELSFSDSSFSMSAK